MLEPEQVAQAYARWIANGEPDFQAMMSPDLHDHVSGATGPQTWDMVWGWIETSFGHLLSSRDATIYRTIPPL